MRLDCAPACESLDRNAALPSPPRGTVAINHSSYRDQDEYHFEDVWKRFEKMGSKACKERRGGGMKWKEVKRWREVKSSKER